MHGVEINRSKAASVVTVTSTDLRLSIIPAIVPRPHVWLTADATSRLVMVDGDFGNRTHLPVRRKTADRDSAIPDENAERTVWTPMVVGVDWC